MSNIRKINEILTEEEAQNCNNYGEYLSDLLDRVEDNKVIGGIKWNKEMKKKVYEVCTTYDALRLVVDNVQNTHNALIRQANAKMEQYTKEKDPVKAKKYMKDYNILLSKIGTLRKELDHYEALRSSYEKKAVDYDAKLDKVREYVQTKQKSTENRATSPKKQ